MADDPPFDLHQLADLLESLVQAIPEEPPETRGLSARSLKKARAAARTLIRQLPPLIEWLDPVTHVPLLDPSDPKVAARYLSHHLEEQPRVPLTGLKPFWGAGVYAVYYRGDHPAYVSISGAEIPIYVGKANPADPQARTAVDQGKKLFMRLGEHARSIRLVEAWATSETNTEGIPAIRLADFDVRFLVLANTYAGAVEENLIRHNMPVWNDEVRICYGIGKHGDLASTRTNTRSPWDTLHPGRRWALHPSTPANAKTWRELVGDVLAYTRSRYPT